MSVLSNARAAWGGMVFVLKIMWSMIVALKRATWDQCVETAQHLTDARLSPWPKLVLVLVVSASLAGAVLVWTLLHGLLPILLLSPIEEVVLTALILCQLWEYNRYSRRKLVELSTVDPPSVVAQEPVQAADERSLLETPSILEAPRLSWAHQDRMARRKPDQEER